jgi:hypothetical protein
MSPRTEPCFLTLNHLATWFTLIGHIKIEGIAIDFVYKKALVEFEEGDSELFRAVSFTRFLR